VISSVQFIKIVLNNMDAKDIAEELYRSFKSQVLWKEVDFKRIDKFEKIIKKRFAIILKETIDKHVQQESNNVGLEPTIIDTPKQTMEEVIEALIESEDNNEELIVMKPGEPMSLLQRITMDQDNQIVQDILREAEEKLEEKTKDLSTENKAKVFSDIAEGYTNKRFKVDIICDSIYKKPNFQIFKGKNIDERDFKSEKVIRRKLVFFAYIDTDKQQNIRETIPTYFANATANITEVDIDVIPIQYQQIWQNKTNL